jgi:hypothetical protein
MPDAGRKWFLAVLLACPPCLAAGLGSLGGGLAAAVAFKGLPIVAGLIAAATLATVWAVRRRGDACPV